MKKIVKQWTNEEYSEIVDKKKVKQVINKKKILKFFKYVDE